MKVQKTFLINSQKLFRGLTKSHMYFECDEEDLKPDCSSGHWILQSYWDPSYILQTNILDFPMGTHEWESKD